MTPRKRVIIKLSDKQQEEIKNALGREVTLVIFQLVGGSQLIVEASDIPDEVSKLGN